MTNETPSILDQVFNTEEEEVETFADILLDGEKEALETAGGDSDDLDKIKKSAKGEADQFSSPQLSTKRNGYIDIAHGWSDNDYVMHIKPYHPKKQYRVTLNRVMFAIAQTMSKVIPSHVKVDMYPPSKTYSIPEVTVRAIGLLEEWSIKDKDLDELNEDLFKVLNALL